MVYLVRSASPSEMVLTMVLNNAQISPITKSQTTPSQQHSLPSNYVWPWSLPNKPNLQKSYYLCFFGIWLLPPESVPREVINYLHQVTSNGQLSHLILDWHWQHFVKHTLTWALMTQLTYCFPSWLPVWSSFIWLLNIPLSSVCLTFTLSRWVQVRPSLEEIKLVFPGPFLFFLFSYALWIARKG